MITKEVVQKLISTVDAGLCRGKGVAIPGNLCVEAAVCYALGLPHGDDPECVGMAVRMFEIKLNDSCWSSNSARAKGLRKIAVAQLGSNTVDQVRFAEIVALETVRQILPMLPGITQELADRCRGVNGLVEAKDAAYAAYVAANATANAANAADVAANAAFYTANAADAASAAAYYAANAANAADAADADKILCTSADICLQALIELKSPGCEYLYLLD